MVLGLIGAFLGLPAALCSGVCAGAVSAGMEAAAQQGEVVPGGAGIAASILGVSMALGLISVVLAIVGAIIVVKKPKPGGALLMVAFVLSAVIAIANPMFILVAILLLIAGILGLVAKPADAPASAPVQPAV
jgi:hypothetical protein